MRGTRGGAAAEVAKYGITPAYAGNTFFVSRFAALSWDHPRVCGEH